MKDIKKFPSLLFKPYRLGLSAANEESYQMTDIELKDYLFTLTCIIISEMVLSSNYLPVSQTNQFRSLYQFLGEEYRKKI